MQFWEGALFASKAKIDVFEFFSSGESLKMETWSEEKVSKNVDFSLFFCTIFPFFCPLCNYLIPISLKFADEQDPSVIGLVCKPCVPPQRTVCVLTLQV